MGILRLVARSQSVAHGNLTAYEWDRDHPFPVSTVFR